MKLEGKVAVVTGGGQGIGRGYARGLAREGAKVVIADIAEAPGRETVAIIEGEGGQADYVRTDVADEDSTKAMAAFATQRFGGVDILVNNAAIFAGLPSASLLDASMELWDRVMAVNVKGPLLCARAVVPSMRERGGGAIVNQTSTATYINTPNRMNYTVSKAAIVPMTKTMAKELAGFGIRVNAIAPGPIQTEALKGVPPEALERVVGQQCIKRLGEPEDLCGALIFLVSDMSAWMSGQVVCVDGGNIMLG